MLALTLTLLLAQAEVPTPNAETSAERSALAAERAAVAAEKAAAAIQRLADYQMGLAPPAAAALPGAAPVDPWTGLVGIGLILITGNAETVTGMLNAAVDKRFGKWGFGMRASGAYGQTRPPEGGEAEVTAYRAGVLLRGDRLITSFASIFALAGIETDHVKSIEVRGFAELGTGIIFVDKREGELERVYLRGDVGFRYSHETRFQYYASPTIPAGTGLRAVSMVGPRIGVVFRYALNREIRFSEEAEFLPNLLGPSRYLVNSLTKLNARLTESLSIASTFLVNFDSAPAEGKKQTDTALTLGLEAAF